MRYGVGILVGLMAAGVASAEPPDLKPELQSLNFLIGRWTTPTHGKVLDTGGSSTGEVAFTAEVGGAVILRKDHVLLYGPSGKSTGSLDILMMIYPEAGGIRADYSDGDHVIHYASAIVDPGRAVTFTSASSPNAPTFKLAYTLTHPRTLDISFSMSTPGSMGFHPIATGSAMKDR